MKDVKLDICVFGIAVAIFGVYYFKTKKQSTTAVTPKQVTFGVRG